jgi:hypothetical protein
LVSLGGELRTADPLEPPLPMGLIRSLPRLGDLEPSDWSSAVDSHRFSVVLNELLCPCMRVD